MKRKPVKPIEVVISDEEKAAVLLKIAADVEEFYRRHPEERPAAREVTAR